TGVPLGVKLHPTQLYESLAMLIVFFFLLWLHRRKKFSGQVILAYVIIYATVRFLIEFVRDDPRGDILGLTTMTGLSTSQLIGIVVGAGALITFVIRRRRANALREVGGAVAPSAAQV
ncbi:MAG TPA: prolipoprotein diacylglyceryl transferase family protein, partial [Pyrinomonadaceae bacterium]